MNTETLNIDELEFENDELENIEESSVDELQKIISYNVANTVEVLKLKVDNEEINLKPEFQRDFVWDINRASLFIDSLIIGLPIPSIFLGKSREDENYIVIDGQQRLKSAYYFMTGKFVNDDSEIIFTLRNLKDRAWNGKSFSELEDKFKKRIRNAVLNTTVIEDIDSKPDVVHDLFHRLNTGGMPLTDQEIRNCIYNGVFNKQILELNKYDNWRKLLDKMAPDKRLRDAELVLRFLALLQESTNYKPSMKFFLSNYQRENKNNTDFIESNKQIFESTVDVILSEIGEQAFKPTRAINKSIVDSLMVAVAQILNDDGNLQNIEEKYKRLLDDENYKRYITSGTSSELSVKGRIDTARSYLSNLI